MSAAEYAGYAIRDDGGAARLTTAQAFELFLKNSEHDADIIAVPMPPRVSDRDPKGGDA